MNTPISTQTLIYTALTNIDEDVLFISSQATNIAELADKIHRELVFLQGFITGLCIG